MNCDYQTFFDTVVNKLSRHLQQQQQVSNVMHSKIYMLKLVSVVF